LSQTACYPIYAFFVGILKKFPNDASFSEEKGKRFIIESVRLTKPKYIYSLDLVSATELLPRQVIYDACVPVLGPSATQL
jgi:hypothetical protein